MRMLSGVIGLFAAATVAAPSSAGIYSDDLSRCLVEATTGADRTELMKWVFAAMSTNPALKDMVKVTPEQRATLDKGVAVLFDRLVLTNCHKEMVAALKYEGHAAVLGSFQLLGQIASREIMTAPQTNEAVGAFVQHIDEEKWAALFAEAGIANTDAAQPAK